MYAVSHGRRWPSWQCQSQINGCAVCIDMHTKDARTMSKTALQRAGTREPDHAVVAINGWNRLVISIRWLGGAINRSDRA